MTATDPNPSMPDAPGAGVLDREVLSGCLRQAPDGVVILDPERKVVFYNRQAKALCGVDRRQVLGQSPACLLSPQELDELLARLQADMPDPAPLLMPAAAHPQRRSSLSLAFAPVDTAVGRHYIAIARDVGMQLQQQRRMRELSQALDGSDNAIVLCDRDARIHYANSGFARMFGHRLDEVMGKRPAELIRGRHTDMAILEQIMAGHRVGSAHQSELLGYRRDGSPLWISVVATPLAETGGSVVNIFTDITAAKTNEVLNGKVLDALMHDEPLAATMSLVCQEIERVAPDVMVVITRCDADGSLVPLAAPGFPPGFHVSPACMQAARRNRAVEVADIASDPGCAAWREQALALGLHASWVEPIRSSTGQVLGTLAFHSHHAGPPTAWHRQLTGLCQRLCTLALEREQTRSRMHRLAFYDVLTGLPNRVMFDTLCEQPLLMAEQHHMPMALLFLGLDRFKRLNETQGHAAADGLLRDLARSLQELAGADAIVGRQLGDEFVLFIPQCDLPRASQLCADLLAMIAMPRVVGSMTVRGSASIGVALYPDNGRSLETLLQHADLAMRRAKDEGGGRFCFFNSDMNQVAQERLLLETTLRDSLQAGGLDLYYQPQVLSDGGGLYGAEALIRWRHPHLGDISPARFVPLAEECGLIVELSNWVLEQACRQHAAWRTRGIEVPRIAVNLSASTFEQPALVGMVRSLLERHGMDAWSLVLEITESVMLSGQPVVLENLHALHALGIDLSLDDFGTGYSSLSHLHHLPISEMKLDRSFTAEIGHSKAARSLILSVLRIGESLDKHVVAEGVETETQRRFLVENGCPVLQGFLFAPAMPADLFEQWLQDQQASPA